MANEPPSDSRRRTSRNMAIACVLANVFSIALNTTIAVVGGVWLQLVLVPVGIFAIGVVVWSWRRWGRWLPG